MWEGYAFANLPDAVSRGLIKEEEINKHLMHVLEERFDLGEMDDDALVPWTKIPASIINNEEHREFIPNYGAGINDPSSK